MNFGKIKITEDIIDGAECYILTEQINSKKYCSIVIDKKNMLITKYGESLSGRDFVWKNYKYNIDTVTDDDIRIKSWENYQIAEIDQNYLNKFQ